jgi:gas vesicle protein GvpN
MVATPKRKTGEAVTPPPAHDTLRAVSPESRPARELDTAPPAVSAEHPTPAPGDAVPARGPDATAGAPSADAATPAATATENGQGAAGAKGAPAAISLRREAGEGRDLAVPRPWAEGRRSCPFFEDGELHSLQSRAIAYLRAGVAVRFQGPAGTGKTAMALRVAHALGRPVAFLTGHSRMTPDDLIGRESGVRSSRIEDKYIASVRRTETRTRADWQEGPLASAMRHGQTLVYDEFTRAPPEANAALLSVLEEGVLVVQHPERGRDILAAAPDFRLVLTSNPADYRGTAEAPDALLDRLVTFELAAHAVETEIGIVSAATGIPRPQAERVVTLLRTLRLREGDRVDSAGAHGATGMPVSMRTAILIARLLVAQGIPADGRDARFVQICADVLRGRLSRSDTEAAVAACLGDAATSPTSPSGRGSPP